MSAVWQKNEVTAAKRRCGMLIRKNDGTLAPRGTDFSGLVLICGVNAPNFDLAVGTMTNQRRPLVLADDVVESSDSGTDELTLTAHLYETGDGPFVADAIIAGNAIGTEYWTISTGADTIQLALSLADAYAGTAIGLGGIEGGTTISDKSTTQRGIDGHFIYTATQAETNHSAPETIVIVDGGGSSDYDRDSEGGAYTTVDMRTASDDFGAAELENGLSRDDGLRIILRTLAAKFSKVGNDYVYRDMADSKDSHHGTVTTAGRVDSVIDSET